MHHPDGWEAQDLPINATGSGGYRHLQFDNSPGQSRVQLYTTDQDSGLTNVTVPEITAPKMLNKKRVAKGKQPFFSYRVLQIQAPRGVRAVAGGGGHAAPRAHLRRGHIRRLEERTVWVRPAMVNLGASAVLGAVGKDYALMPTRAT